MITHLKALKQLTEDALGYETFLGQVNGERPVQYMVWQGPGGAPAGELPVAAVSDDLDANIRLLARGEEFESVGIMLQLAQQHFSPGKAPRQIDVPGRSAWIQWVRSEFIDADPDERLTSGGRPFYGVDTYHLISEPRS